MKYPFNVFQMQVEQHVFWVAKSAQLNGCIGQGDSMEDAINELAENEEAWLETAKDLGLPIPNVAVEQVQEYSGKLTLRVSSSVHKKAAMLAKREGISLNQYINDAVTSYNSELMSASYISDRIIGIVDQIKGKFLNSVSVSNEGSTTVVFPIASARQYYSVMN